MHMSEWVFVSIYIPVRCVWERLRGQQWLILLPLPDYVCNGALIGMTPSSQKTSLPKRKIHTHSLRRACAEPIGTRSCKKKTKQKTALPAWGMNLICNIKFISKKTSPMWWYYLNINRNSRLLVLLNVCVLCAQVNLDAGWGETLGCFDQPGFGLSLWPQITLPCFYFNFNTAPVCAALALIK